MPGGRERGCGKGRVSPSPAGNGASLFLEDHHAALPVGDVKVGEVAVKNKPLRIGEAVRIMGHGRGGRGPLFRLPKERHQPVPDPLRVFPISP